jgi:hypothetical protein
LLYQSLPAVGGNNTRAGIVGSPHSLPFINSGDHETHQLISLKSAVGKPVVDAATQPPLAHRFYFGLKGHEVIGEGRIEAIDDIFERSIFQMPDLQSKKFITVSTNEKFSVTSSETMMS